MTDQQIITNMDHMLATNTNPRVRHLAHRTSHYAHRRLLERQATQAPSNNSPKGYKPASQSTNNQFTIEELLASGIDARDGEIRIIDLSGTPLGPLFDPSVDLRAYVENFDNYQSIRDWITTHLMTPQ